VLGTFDSGQVRVQASPGTGTDAITTSSTVTNTSGGIVWGCISDNTAGPSTIAHGTNYTLAQNKASDANQPIITEYLSATGSAVNVTATTSGNGSDQFLIGAEAAH
jgi:hypothetical protein